MSDTPFGFGLPPEEPENGDEGKRKGGQGGPNPFGFPGMGLPGGAGGQGTASQ